MTDELDAPQGTDRQEVVDHFDRDVLVVSQEVAGHDERHPDHGEAGDLARPRPTARQVSLGDLEEHQGQDDDHECDTDRLFREAEPAHQRAEGLPARKDLRGRPLAEPVLLGLATLARTERLLVAARRHRALVRHAGHRHHREG